MAVAFMYGLNKNNPKYQEWVNELANAYSYGRDEYPKDLVVAYHRSIERKGHATTSQRTSRSNDGVSFVTDGHVESGISHTQDGVLLKRNSEPVVCFICEKNHLKQNCPVYKKRQADNATNDKVGETPADPPIPNVHDNAVTIGVEDVLNLSAKLNV